MQIGAQKYYHGLVLDWSSTGLRSVGVSESAGLVDHKGLDRWSSDCVDVRHRKGNHCPWSLQSRTVGRPRYYCSYSGPDWSDLPFRGPSIIFKMRFIGVIARQARNSKCYADNNHKADDHTIKRANDAMHILAVSVQLTRPNQVFNLTRNSKQWDSNDIPQWIDSKILFQYPS